MGKWSPEAGGCGKKGEVDKAAQAFKYKMNNG